MDDRSLPIDAALQRLRRYSEKRAELERMLPGVHQDIRDIYAAGGTTKAEIVRACGLSRVWVDKILAASDVRRAS